MYFFKSFLLIVSCFTASFVIAQTDSSVKQKDTATKPKPAEEQQPSKPEKDTSQGSSNNNNTAPAPQQAAQDTTITNPLDSLQTDTLNTANTVTIATLDTTSFYKYESPYFNLHTTPVYTLMQLKPQLNSDILFYAIALCVLFVGAVRAISPKYINSIFKLLRQPALQKQTKDQSQQQSNISSWLLNIFFVISSALFLSLCIDKYYHPALPFLKLFLYAGLIIAVAYIAKYFILVFAGWIFNIKEITNSYTFIEMLINKIIGMLLLPFIIIVAFAMPSIAVVAATAGICVVSIFMLYRYIIAVTTLKRFAKVNGLHFFIYLCAVEIAPALIIIKAATQYLG